MSIAAAGDRALLVTLEGATARRLRAVADAIRRIDGVEAAIIGHESVYTIGTVDRDAVARAIANAGEADASAAKTHRVEVSFAPEHALDLDTLLARTGVPRDEVIARIAATPLTVRYLGFKAGFAYLEGWPAEWSLPRRPTSRNLVRGGTFAVAGVMAGFYPTDSPGGWNLLGRTDTMPQRLMPGDEVHVVPVDRPLSFVESPPMEVAADSIADVITPGQLTTLVHARDWKLAEGGETPGGPFDGEAAAIANEAAGNAANASLLECVLVGPRLRFVVARRVAWCGPGREPRVWSLSAGEEIDIGRIRDGFRGYLAIEGGVESFGKSVATGSSRSAGVVPASGRLLKAGETPAPHGLADRLIIRAIRGPHDAPRLPDEWDVTPNMNRVGIRLKAVHAVDVALPTEMPSCGMQFGTLQWHPDGSVVAMGPEHPVTGGYVQPATVVSSDLWKLGQLAPGERVRLLVW